MAGVARQRLTQVALAYTLFGALSVGLLATFVPRTFYDDFPFFASWVDNLPPYNAHLTTDTGGLYLGFAVLLAWALRNRALVVPVCAAFALAQLIHAAFHLTHLGNFSVADGVAQTVSLVGLVGAPLVAIAAAREDERIHPRGH